MSRLVSIIVPVYNVELYVNKCIESLLAQTYNHIEIILIDDGSPDNCGRIIDYYKNRDDRIIAIHKINEGVSEARNAGLAIANGDYIMFVDGDDYVEPNYVSYFVSLISERKCEIAVSSKFYSKENQPQFIESIEILDAKTVVEMIYLRYIDVAVWNKIYSKSFLDKHGLTFNTSFWYAEGMLFNVICLQYVDKIVVGNQRVYHAVNNPASATRKFSLKSHFCGLRSMELQRDSWLKTNQDIQMAWEYHYRGYAESILRGLLENNTQDEYIELFHRCEKIMKSNIRIPIQANIDNARRIDAICTFIDPQIVINGIERFNQCRSVKERFHLFVIKVFNRIPYKIKTVSFNALRKYYKSHYKPVYLYRSLL